ncbi:hypothetical protein [uncultured Clostridium sp.]|nr:hypothetical protein [uncultured Clostridium sp.]
MMNIWTEVLESGNAFPQIEKLKVVSIHINKKFRSIELAASCLFDKG